MAQLAWSNRSTSQEPTLPRIPFDDETKVDRFDDETRMDSGETPDGPRLFAAVDGNLVSFELPGTGQLSVGRSVECDIPIDHPSVSRQHITLLGGPPMSIRDQNSSNGTWLGGRRIPSGKSTVVKPGQVFRMGDVTLWVEDVKAGRGEEAAVDTHKSDPNLQAPVVIEDEAMKSLYELVDRVAHGSIHVLLLGETGVGKEVVARAIHFRSNRAHRPFVALNCAAFSEQLLESELFGHERGAFTGAAKSKPGLLETANGGTILLDEVGELSLGSQAKVLRALEERRVLRLGSLKPRPIDVRFVSATNRDLTAEVDAGRFRRDLYYRLNGVTLHIPPLRKRPAEIVPLARRYVRLFSAKLGRTTPELEPGTLEALRGHRWPGNIRELRNVIERAVLLCGDEPIGAAHLLIHSNTEEPSKVSVKSRSARKTDHQRKVVDEAALVKTPVESAPLKTEMETLERQKILNALDECGGNQTRTAKRLGISRNTLIRKLDRYGVPRPRKRKG